MKAVLMSMKQKWWEKILAGEKGLEIRKTAPGDGAGGSDPWPLLVLVYVSGTRAVQGQFTCPGYIKTNLLMGIHKQACLPLGDLVDYAGGPGRSVCGWIVKNPEKYDRPSPLAELGLISPPMSWQYVEITDEEVLSE